MEANNIIWIIIGTGIFGGIINYFRNVFDKKIILLETIKPLLLGLAASALVPLFLNMISSDLLTSPIDNGTNYLVFLGFCLIAAMFSGEFIDSIGKKVLNEIDEVKREIEDNNTENDAENIEGVSTNSDLTDEQRKVLESFIGSQYTYRSISGISKESNLDKTMVKNELVKLQKEGLVDVVQRQKGPRWRITSEGYKK